MGDEGSRRVVERVAEAIDRIGGAHDGTDSEPSANAASDSPAVGAAVTDGGADEASPGDGPWAADDPIAFGEESEAEPGTAILDAVTDDGESTPPFGEAGADASAADGDAPVSDDRLDELEARIGALESDHVQLESQLADVASAVSELGTDVDRVGEDVLELVTLFGAAALASGGPEQSALDPADVAAALADELDGSLAAAAAEGSEAAGAGHSEADPDARADDSVDTIPAEGRSDSIEDPDAPTDDHALDPTDVPDGINRGVGGAPSDSPTTPGTEDGSTVTGAEPADTASTDTPGSNAGEPARELVDPRTDAVGARLRQFREGFADDPTEDLPTGSSADDFQFEKVLLPTDEEEIPDLSTEELAKPYLQALPDGYAADAVVLEWLDWLVSAADAETAARAIGYYESIDWLTGDARAELLGYLEGLGDTGAVDGSTQVHEPPAALDLQAHLRSLQYVTELATGEVDPDGI